MTDQRIIPIILCGGSGTRLWPASRESFPKQFLPLAGERTLLQETALRVADPARFGRPIVIANHEHRFIVAEQLEQIGVAALIALEPLRRDSAAAIGAAARLAQADDPEALTLVLASDQLIGEPEPFLAVVEAGVAAARAGRIVAFGLKPSRPATQYGYVRAGSAIDGAPGVFDVEAFVEKPNEHAAAALVAEGCLWNSGNFLAQAKTLLAELARLAPGIAGPAVAAADGATHDLDFLRLHAGAFAEAQSLAIDYAVMEKTPLAAVAPGDFGWSDVGGWAALWEAATRDPDGNALVGHAAAVASKNCYVRSDGRLAAVVGLDGAVVVATKDAVLVTTRARSGEVRELVAALAAQGEPAASQATVAHRPWGAYEVLDQGEGFQVKRITVKPGRRLSLQSHVHRAEHWVVVRGTARVTVGDEVRDLSANQSVYIPLGARHRLENPGSEPLDLIEVQSGPYLGEDDIVRYEDDFRRS